MIAAMGTAPSPRPHPRKLTPRAPARRDLDYIVGVAIAVFTQRGYTGTSIADLAQASGLAKSSVYHHVRSKRHLFELAVDHAMGKLIARSSAIAASGGTSLDQLRTVMRESLCGAIDGDPNIGLIRRLPAMAGAVPTVMERYRHYEMLVSSFVRQAAEDGYLRSDIEPTTLNRILWMMGTAAADVRLLDPDIPTEQLAEDAVSIMLQGSMTAAADEPPARTDAVLAARPMRPTGTANRQSRKAAS
jgi:AcrR family transcriptional regulator